MVRPLKLRPRGKRLEVLPDIPPGIRRQGRLVPRGRVKGPIRLGNHDTWYTDIYHRTLTVRWPAFLVCGSLLYLALNVVFAALFWARADAIDHARPGSFIDAFFFSIQTMATIGYGVLTPSGTYANVIVTVETMVSLLFVAFTTGITFSRFSRPTARVDFSKVAVVSLHNGIPTLSVRLSNARRNQILEADVSLVLLRMERTLEGRSLRRFYDLKLSRGHTPVFALTFTAMHAIDEPSPMFGMTPEMMQAEVAELLVTVTGLDETMSQTIHARTSYLWDEILFGHRFRDMFGFTPEGRLVIDHALMDEVEASPLTAQTESEPVNARTREVHDRPSPPVDGRGDRA